MIAVAGRGLIGSAVARAADVRVLDGDTRSVGPDQLDGVRVLVHTAFKSVDTDGTGFDGNVTGTANLLAAARQAGVQRVISTSTTGVYGHEPHHGADEDTPLAPDTPFARSRAEADALVLGSGLEAVVLRTRFVYGQGDAAVLPRIHRAASRSPVWVDGGRAELSLVWVDDLARVVLAAADAPLPEQPVLHVTDGVPVAFRVLATELCERLGGRVPRASVPLPWIHGPVRAWERLRGIDPETSASAVSSIRLRLAAQPQVFASDRLRAWLPDLRFTPRADALDRSAGWYRSLLDRTPPSPGRAR